MTSSRYFISKFFKSFGLDFSEKHRTAAAYEAHLLRDAQNIIGGLAWEKVEDIDELSSEYWSLRKLSKEYQELDSQIENLTEVLDTAQEQRSQTIENVSSANRGTASNRDSIHNRIERLSKEREDIQQQGRTIKRSYEGLKTKLEVLREEEATERNQFEIKNTTKKLEELREQFDKVKNRRGQIDEKKTELQTELNALNQKLSKEDSVIREQAESQFSIIGQTNKKLNTLRSSLSNLENEISSLHDQIGRHIIKNIQDPRIKEAAKQYKGLISLTQEVHKSTLRNRSLIG